MLNGSSQPPPEQGDESPEEKIERLEAEIGHLQARLEENELLREEEVENLKERIQTLESQVKSLEASREVSEERIQTLEREVQDLNSQVKSLKASQKISKETEAHLILAEMCHQLQNKMYKEVHPKNFINGFDYGVKKIKRDIDDREIYPEEKDRKEAGKRWRMLVTKIGWDDKYLKTIKELLKNRNTRAHPRLNANQDLRWCVEAIEGNLPPLGDFSAESVRGLIHMHDTVN